MIAPPGYPKITSTPASTSERHKIWAPVSISVIGSDSPEIDGVERAVLELVGVARLVEGVHDRAGARFDDVRRRAARRQRLPRHPPLDHHLSEPDAPRCDRPDHARN